MLGELLVKSGLISRQDLARIESELSMQSPRKPIPSLLDEMKLVSVLDMEPVLRQAAELAGLEFQPTVSTGELSQDLLAKVPVEWARYHLAVPITTPLGPAMLFTDPGQMEAIEDMRMMLGSDLRPILAPPDIIRDAIELGYFHRDRSSRSLASSIEHAEVNQSSHEDSGSASGREPVNDLLRESDHAPVTRLVNAILLEALKASASDIHIEPFQSDVKIRYRVDGMLYEQASPPRSLLAGLVSRLKVMARLDIAEKRLPQDGTATVRIGPREVDIRVSTIPVMEGERVVLRLLHRSESVLQLESLGISPDTLHRFEELLGLTQGVVLITGPTGSGKTTTLYSALQKLDRTHLNIMTIEDPVEYQLKGIGQIQVKPQIGLSFATGLRHILRQDPDIVLVGETRDLETAEIMIRASLTGHLVFSTLHTNDAPSALIRLADMGIEPYLIASSVKAVLAQRLVRKLCPSCRRRVPADPRLVARIAASGGSWTGHESWVADGCALCHGGYRGRIGVYELFRVSEQLQDLIRSGLSSSKLRQTAIAGGMTTLLDDGLHKAAAGVTSLEEVLRVCGDHGA